MLQSSIPLWEKFNTLSYRLRLWFDEADSSFKSDVTVTGNAIVTERILNSTEVRFM